MVSKLEKVDYKECSSCLGLQEIISKCNLQCILLELDVHNRNSVIQSLEDEVTILKLKNEELEKRIQNGKDYLLTIDEELEMDAMELQKRSSEIVQTKFKKAHEDEDASGPFHVNTPFKQYANSDGVKGGPKLKPSVRKWLNFANEGSTLKDITPTTPPFGHIYISDSGDEDDDQNVHSSTLGITQNKKKSTSKDNGRVIVEIEDDDDDEEENDDDIPCNNLKRKVLKKGSGSNIVSESESEDDEEDIPCNKRKRKVIKKRRGSNIVSESESESDFNENDSSSKDNLKKRTRKRRLTKLGSVEEKGVFGNSPYKNTRSKKRVEIPTNKNETSEEAKTEEDDDSESDNESLSNFIVKSDDEVSEHTSSFSGDDSKNSLDDDSDSNISYKGVMSSLRRERKDRTWAYESDMLADLAKSPELCMKAVCAIYRLQTSEEKNCKATISRNGQGFSQIHAHMGSTLAEFVTGGDPQGDVTKSVEELLEFDPEGCKKCENLARCYSKQLFEVYKKGTDPFYGPFCI